MKLYKLTISTRNGEFSGEWHIYSPEAFASDSDALASNDVAYTAEFKRADLYLCNECFTAFLPMQPIPAGDACRCSNCTISI
jgi:hypothetical protein